jgi:hypothetical protein
MDANSSSADFVVVTLDDDDEEEVIDRDVEDADTTALFLVLPTLPLRVVATTTTAA